MTTWQQPAGRALLTSALVAAFVAACSGGPPDPVVLFETESVGSSSSPGTLLREAHRTLHVRSVREFELAAVRDTDALIRIEDADGRAVAGVGRVDVPDAPLLGGIVNSGWIATFPDGGIVFAAALRPEVSRYDPDGALLWRRSRSIDVPLIQPALRLDNGALAAHFAVVQHGIAVGADSRIYVLAATTNADSLRVDVLTPDGLPAESRVIVRGVLVLADRNGRLSSRAPGDETPELPRTGLARFADFDLPDLLAPRRVRLSDYDGHVTVVNFWASWCVPCRREMPHLDALAHAFEGRNVEIVGLNEDVDPDAARAFLDRIGGVRYSLAQGSGRLRQRYMYRGLPYTVVLTPEHEVAATFYGFGEDIDALREAIELEIRRAGRTRVSSVKSSFNEEAGHAH